MATTTERRSTFDGLLKITDRTTPELIDGPLVEREPIGQEADVIATSIVASLKSFAKTQLLSVVNGSECGDQIFTDDPGRVRFPDVSFTRRDRLPDGKAGRVHSRVVPDLLVEVVSPNDNATELKIKVREFLHAGVPLFWVVTPASRDIEVFRADGTGALLKEGNTLDGGDILPGFSCPVAAVFE